MPSQRDKILAVMINSVVRIIFCKTFFNTITFKNYTPNAHIQNERSYIVKFNEVSPLKKRRCKL